MTEDRDVQTSPRSPARRSTEEKQQRDPRPSKPDRAPRRLTSTKRTPVRHSAGHKDHQDPRTDDAMAPPRFKTSRAQGADQPCSRLRQLTTVDGGVALQRLYAIIQRQRDEWYQSHYASGSPAPTTANPQNESTPTTIDPSVNTQGRTSVTPGVVSGGMTGPVSYADNTKPSRVTTTFMGPDVSEFCRSLLQYDQDQRPGTSRQVMPNGFTESQSVRFQSPLGSPTDQKPGVVTTRDSLPSDHTPTQEISGGTPDSTAFKQTGHNLSGGTLESSTTQRQSQDISGGIPQASFSQQQSEGQVMSGQVRTEETERLSSSERPGHDFKGGTSKSDSLQRLGSEEPAGNTQPRQSGTEMPGVAAQHLRDTIYSNAPSQPGTRQSDTSPLPQALLPSRCSCACLHRQSVQQKDSLPQSAKQPCSKVPRQRPPPRQCPPPCQSYNQAPLGPRPEAYHSDVPGITSGQAPAGSSQHIASSQSPGASGMQMSNETSHELPSPPRPAESGNQAPEGDSLKATGLPGGPDQGPIQQPPGHAPQPSEPQASEPQAKNDSVGYTLGVQEHINNSRESQAVPTARAMEDPKTFEEQVSVEFQILKELALSLRNLRYLPIPPPPPPPVGTAFENCVLDELRSIRSRCIGYTQFGMQNHPVNLIEGKGSGAFAGPQNTNQPVEPQELSQGQYTHIPDDSAQVSTFEQKVIAALRSINRNCEGSRSTLVNQNVSLPVRPTDVITGQSPSSATLLFEELVLSKVNEMGKEFFCKLAAPPTVSGGEPAQVPQPTPEPVVQPVADPTSDTRRTSDARISQGGANRPSDTSQQDHTKPDEQTPQSNMTQNHSSSRVSGADASAQPVDPSYIKDSSQGTTPFTGRIGSLTFDTTASSSPAGINRPEQSNADGHVQSQVQPGREMNPVEDKQRRDSLEAAVVQPSGASGQDLAQRQSRNDQLLPNPPNVSWVVNSPTSQRISEPPQRSVHVQETMNMGPDMIGQRITLHSTAGNKDERTTDDCETGSMDGDSDCDLDSIDSCSPQRLGFARPPCVSPRQTNDRRRFNQTSLDCDYSYNRCLQLAALTDCRQRLTVPANRSDWKSVGQQAAPSGPAELTQYTMSDTQTSMSPRVHDPQSIADPCSASYKRPQTLIRSSATVPLSSTLKEGHVQPTDIVPPTELPSMIESERHRSMSTQEPISAGNLDGAQALQNRSLGQAYASGPQHPLSRETGQGLRSSFDCSHIYYKVASNAPIVDNRYRLGFSSSGVCDQLDQEAAEESHCWDDDDDPNPPFQSGFARLARDEPECMTGSGSGFQQRGRPCATSLESQGLRRNECATPWPGRGRPTGVHNRWPPLHELNCSGERLRPTKKTFTDSCGRRMSNRGRRAYGKASSGIQTGSVAGVDLRCRPKNAEHIIKSTRLNVMNCMGVAPPRPKYAVDDPCASSESETDCEF